MTLTPIRDLLGVRRQRLPFMPAVPDNNALDCWRCPHRWHGLGCRVAICPCSTSWVQP